jgi:RNA processing factor Prp31
MSSTNDNNTVYVKQVIMSKTTKSTDKEEKKLVNEMCCKFIIPNWYKPSHFKQMEGWDEDKVEDFKDYLLKCVLAHDEIYEYVEEVLENFIRDEEESNDDNE